MLIFLEDREEMGACAYDRTYYFIKESMIQNKKSIKKEELLQRAYTVKLENTINFPHFVMVAQNAYEIGEKLYITIRGRKE